MVTRGRTPSGRSSYDTLTLACLSGADLGPKLVSVERALSAIRAGSRVYIGTGCAAPRTLLAQLEAMNPAPADLEFVSFVTTSALPQVEGASRTRYRHRAFFASQTPGPHFFAQSRKTFDEKDVCGRPRRS